MQRILGRARVGLVGGSLPYRVRHYFGVSGPPYPSVRPSIIGTPLPIPNDAKTWEPTDYDRHLAKTARIFLNTVFRSVTSSDWDYIDRQLLPWHEQYRQRMMQYILRQEITDDKRLKIKTLIDTGDRREIDRFLDNYDSPLLPTLNCILNNDMTVKNNLPI
jgi:hypothetical protein